MFDDLTASNFLTLEVADQPQRYRLALTADVCVGPPGRQHMFGGVGLGAAIAAMERASERPIVWATAHYLAFARFDQVVDIDVEVLIAGRFTTQAAATGRIGDEEVFRVVGALGTRPSEISQQWRNVPSVLDAESYPKAQHWRGAATGLHERLDVRVAKGRYGHDRVNAAEPDGRLILWVRSRHSSKVDASFLAVIADLLPSGIGNALGMNAGGNSLDNTLRVLQIVSTDWVLAEILIHGVASGIVHGEVRLFAQTGELMAIGSQTLIARIHETAAVNVEPAVSS